MSHDFEHVNSASSTPDLRAFDRYAKPPPAWELLDNGLGTIDEICRACSLPLLGRETLISVLDSDPALRVVSTPKSVASHVPSSKMRRFIQAASRTVELALLYLLEHNPDVLLYADQPFTVEIQIRNTRNHRRTVNYTPDYLALHHDGVRVYQCKDTQWLRDQAQKPNARYVYDSTLDVWRHPAAEEAFRPYGYSHHVFHSEEINALWLRNIRFLQDFISADPPPGVEEARAWLRSAHSLLFAEALRIPGTLRESWFWLIANGEAFFDLERDPLDRPDLLVLASLHDTRAAMLCHRIALDSRVDFGVLPSLSTDSAVLALDPGTVVLYQQARHQVVSRDCDNLVLCVKDDSQSAQSGSPPVVIIPIDTVPELVKSGLLRAVPLEARELVARQSCHSLASVTDVELRRVLKRWTAVCDYRTLGIVREDVSRTSLFEYLAWARQGAISYGSELLGMIRPRGGVPLSVVVSDEFALRCEVAEAFHAGKYSSRCEGNGVDLPLPSRRRVTSAYADYVRLCAERSLKPLSSKTLRREIERYPLERSVRARRGSRAAYPYTAPVGQLSGSPPVHGMRPFEIAHVDHQLLDVWCVSGATGALLGRPWLTLIFDAYSRMPLGFCLRFDSPCIYSVMCAIYDCVSRHGRFADSLVSDQGPEFESPDLIMALGYLHTTHVRRPPSKPRFGSLIERVFGSIKTRVIDELSGSIDTVARTRELTSSHDPRLHACWTLANLSKLLEQFFFVTYPSLIHAEFGEKPGEVFEFGLAQAGERVARHVPLDDNLDLSLSETVPGRGGTRTVPTNGGPIPVCHLRFHHPVFSDARVAGHRLPVRRCSIDASFVRVFIPHLRAWEKARLVSGSIDLSHSSWRQARAFIEERARQHLIASLPGAQTANALVMSELLVLIDKYECESLERQREIEAEQHLESAVRTGDDFTSDDPIPHPVSLPHSDGPASQDPVLQAPLFDSTQLRSYDHDDYDDFA